jgi:hypothetical protein
VRKKMNCSTKSIQCSKKFNMAFVGMLHLLKFNFDNVIQLFIMFCLHLIGPIFNVFGNPLGSHWTTLSFHLTCSVFKMFEMNIIHYKKSWSFQFDKLVKKVKICTFFKLNQPIILNKLISTCQTWPCGLSLPTWKLTNWLANLCNCQFGWKQTMMTLFM